MVGKAAVLAAVMITAGVSVSGCVTTRDGIATQQTDPNDVCLAQRRALDGQKEYFNKDVAVGMGLGALTGGLVAALASRGDVGSIVLGAVTGAIGGGLAGYWTSMQNKKLAGTQLYSTLNADMTSELDNVNRTQAAYNDLVNCRKEEATQVRALFVSGKLNREQANAELDKVRVRATQDYEIARQINKRVKERTDSFAYATRQATGKDAPVTTRAVITGTPAATEAGSLQCCSALQASYTNFDKSVAAAPKSSDFQLQ
jgi:uncharacterized protein YcfJ